MSTDFTPHQLGALTLACRLLAIDSSGAALPRGTFALTLRLRRTLAALRQCARTDRSLVTRCPQVCRAIASIPAHALRCPVQGSASVSEPDAELCRLKELLARTGEAMVVSAAHAKNGCPKAADCLFCL